MSNSRTVAVSPTPVEYHYDEAQKYRDRPAYIGSINDDKSPLKAMLNDIDSHRDHKDQSLYFGAFFYADQDVVTSGMGWSYEKNKAFMAGAIDAGRNFILVTDIATSYFKNNKVPMGVTTSELAWLAGNNYKFRPATEKDIQELGGWGFDISDASKFTVAESPGPQNLRCHLTDYQKNRIPVKGELNNLSQHIANIRETVIRLRHNNHATSSLTSGLQNRSSTSSTSFTSSSSATSATTSASSSNTRKYIPPNRRAQNNSSVSSVSSTATVPTETVTASSDKSAPSNRANYASEQTPPVFASPASGISLSTATTNNSSSSRVMGPPPGFAPASTNSAPLTSTSSSTASVFARLGMTSSAPAPAPTPSRPPPGFSAAYIAANGLGPRVVAPAPIPIATVPNANSSSTSTSSDANDNGNNQSLSPPRFTR